MTFTYDESIVSDLHKDAYGYRPREDFWSRWSTMNPEQKQEEWEFLLKTMDEAIELEHRAQEKNHGNWLNHINSIIKLTNRTRAEAIELDMEVMDVQGDVGYYCYKWDMSYSVEDEIDNILNDSEDKR